MEKTFQVNGTLKEAGVADKAGFKPKLIKRD
jgi:hypothetical protein